MQRKAVHYINQFYAGLGGETMADTGFSILEEKKGPALGLEQLWKGEMEISTVVCCGDNYVNTEANEAEVFARLTEVIRRDQPDVFIAGPAFNAGRYGVACAQGLRLCPPGAEGAQRHRYVVGKPSGGHVCEGQLYHRQHGNRRGYAKNPAPIGGPGAETGQRGEDRPCPQGRLSAHWAPLQCIPRKKRRRAGGGHAGGQAQRQALPDGSTASGL